MALALASYLTGNSVRNNNIFYLTIFSTQFSWLQLNELLHRGNVLYISPSILFQLILLSVVCVSMTEDVITATVRIVQLISAKSKFMYNQNENTRAPYAKQKAIFHTNIPISLKSKICNQCILSVTTFMARKPGPSQKGIFKSENKSKDYTQDTRSISKKQMNGCSRVEESKWN